MKRNHPESPMSEPNLTKPIESGESDDIASGNDCSIKDSLIRRETVTRRDLSGAKRDPTGIHRVATNSTFT